MTLCFDPRVYDKAMNEIEECLEENKKNVKKRDMKTDKKVYFINC
jgi:hypothetical protein